MPDKQIVAADSTAIRARDASFSEAQHASATELAQRYFAGRTDGLRPPNNAEELLVATTWALVQS